MIPPIFLMPMIELTTRLTSVHTNLQRLLIARALFSLAVSLTLGLCYFTLATPLPYLLLIGILSGLTLINFVSWLRLVNQPETAGNTECFIQLVIDLLGITALLFFTGGANNPFVAYYLVPLCLAASFLPRRFTLSLTLLALILYSGLFYFNVPLPQLAPQPHSHHLQSTSLNSHSLGMWFSFLLSALLITIFVAQMAAALRQQDAELANLREETLRDEQLMAVATLAAGTAHELATPLSTMKTLVSEMQADYDQPGLKADLEILKNQIQHCTRTLRQLHQQAGLSRQSPPAIDVGTYCRELFDRWLLLHPAVDARLTLAPDCPPLSARFDPTIEQSISNLLNNAADACSHQLDVHCHWNHQQLTMQIDDDGPGIAAAMQKKLGQAYHSSKGDGRGLGLFLTHATLTRYGGEVELTNRPQGGTRTRMHLPLNLQLTDTRE